MTDNPNLPVPIATAPPQVYECLPVEAIKRQVDAIHELIRSVMKDGEHFGVIPGTGSKPALLQPGAQKLCLAFQFSPELAREDILDLPHGHREVRCTVRLTHRPSGTDVAEGVGTCSTMESRYRYRWDAVAPLGSSHPYWQARDLRHLPPGTQARKIAGKWVAAKREENQDAADSWNTVRKMAFKRALVAAVLNATAASDCFTQDVEDHPQPQEPAESAAPEPATPWYKRPEAQSWRADLERMRTSLGWDRGMALAFAADALQRPDLLKLKGEAVLAAMSVDEFTRLVGLVSARVEGRKINSDQPDAGALTDARRRFWMVVAKLEWNGAEVRDWVAAETKDEARLAAEGEALIAGLGVDKLNDMAQRLEERLTVELQAKAAL